MVLYRKNYTVGLVQEELYRCFSVNPARFTSQAIFAGGDYVGQLWLFWLAPILGAAVGALVYRGLIQQKDAIE